MARVHLVIPTSAARAEMMARIWPEPYAADATLAYTEDWETGQIFLVMTEEEIVGVTGYFVDKDPSLVYLRWTGILPEYRRTGHAAAALTQLISLLKHDYEGRKLVELVPANEYGAPVREFFLALGFRDDPDAYIPPVECADWPTIAMTVTI